MKITVCLLVLTLPGCQSGKKAEKEKSEINTDETLKTPAEEIHYDYTSLYGIYDHESTTHSFGSVVSLRQNGIDLYFTVSSIQGTCKAETEGIIAMIEHNQQFYIGFSDIENCPLQFTFYPAEGKVDIKEVSLCSVHGSTCSFEGVYVKRSTESR